MKKWVIGVDEAGRGPLAGPVSVGVAVVPSNFDWSLLPGVNDSKQLSEKRREEIYKMAFQLQKNGKLHFSVSMVSAVVIDNIGIVSAVNLGMSRSLKKLTGTIPFKWNSSGELVDVVVKLDGGLKAPSEFIHQETIIKGDSKEKVIGLASIVAKVTRDRYMVRKSAEPIFAPYNLEAHKGYGTKAHRAAIKENGLSVIHRRSFCKNLLS